MDDKPGIQSETLGDLIGTKELLQLVLKKLASQALVFGLAVVVIVVVAGWLFRDRANQGLPIIVAVLFVFVVAFVGYLFAEQSRKVQQGDPATMNRVLGNKMKTIESKNADFYLDLWTERADAPEPTGSRDIGVKPKSAAYRVGDKIVVRFRATRDCHLTLLNVGTSGRLTILFPNSLHRDNAIKAGRDYSIPGPDYGFEYELQGPPGIERLKAVATLENVTLLESNFDAEGSFFRVVPPATGARDIGLIQKKVASLPQQKWAEASSEFRVG